MELVAGIAAGHRIHSSELWGSFSRPFGLRDGTGFRMLPQPVRVGRNVRTERLDLLIIPFGAFEMLKNENDKE